MSPVVADMFCRRCRYQLVGLLVHRCPECGRPFDPRDPRTFWQPGAKRRRRVVPLLSGAVAGAMIGGACTAALHSLDGWTVALCFLSAPMLVVSAACCADEVIVRIVMMSGCALLYTLYSLGLSAPKWRHRLASLVVIAAVHCLSLFAFVWMMVSLLAEILLWNAA